MTAIGNFKLYDIFRKDLHLPDNKAMEVVSALDEFFDKKSFRKIELLATKDELLTLKNELKQEIHLVATRLDGMATKQELYSTKNELKQEIHAVATRLDLMTTKDELHDFKLKLTESIHNTETRLTRNFGVMTLGQVLIVIISVCTILKYAGILR